MYPRNAASPERIAVGPVVQISDGAVQTSGCSVKVMPQGGTASASGGTVAYEEGIVHYLPTQAETNYTSFMVIAYKTGCIPASVTVVTSASATAGKVVLSGETHTSAVVPTVTTVTSQLTAAQIATGVWQDATAGDFTTASSIGKALYINNVAPGGSGGHLISGSNSGTTTFGALTVTGAMTYTGAVVLTDVSTAGSLGKRLADLQTDLDTIDTAGEIAAAVWNADATTYQTQGTFGQAIGDPVTDTNSIFKAVVTDATGATVGVDTAAILDDTGTAGVVVAAGSKTGYTLTATTGLGNQTANITGTISGNVGGIATGGITSGSFAAGAITAAAIATDAIDNDAIAADVTAVVADAVWNAATASYGTAGTYGALIESGNVGGGAIVAASVTGNVGGNVTGSVGSVATGGITAASIAADAIGASELAADAVAEIADAVWDELLSGHAGAGSAGLALSTASSGGVDPSVLADAIWDEALSGHSTAGTAGKALADVLQDTGTDIPATLSTLGGYIDTEIAAILADTDELQKAITDGGRTDNLIDAIKAKTDAMPSAATISTQVASDLAAAHGAGSWATATGFSTHSAADVVTALGTGSTLTALAMAANLATLDTLVDRIAPLLVGNVTGAGTGTEVYSYGGVTATVTVDVDGNVSNVVFS